MSESEKTIEICSIVVNTSGNLLRYVPHHLKTLELCQLALRDKNFSWQKAIPRIFWQTLNLSKEWYIHSQGLTNMIKERQFILN